LVVDLSSYLLHPLSTPPDLGDIVTQLNLPKRYGAGSTNLSAEAAMGFSFLPEVR
jgi:hypothetical protein